MKNILILFFFALVITSCQKEQKPIINPNPTYELSEDAIDYKGMAEGSSEVKHANVLLPLESSRKDISYITKDGMALFEGDIELGTTAEVVKPRPPAHPQRPDFSSFNTYSLPLIGTTSQPLTYTDNEECKWQYGILPYTIDEAFTTEEKRAIIQSMAHLEDLTTLNFVIRNGHDDYIHFKKDEDLAGGKSPVGRQGGDQNITLGSTNQYVILHEILHAAGFFHEHSREDRDKFVTILYDNIEDEHKHNFETRPGFYLGDYDITSIMQYHGLAFGKEDEFGNRSATILNNATGTPVVINGQLSPQDIDGVNIIYPIDYVHYITPPLTTLRILETNISQLKTLDGSDGCGGVEFQARFEVGSNWNWTPGRDNNSTNKHRTQVIDGNDIETNKWNFQTPVPINQQRVKVFIEIWEMDDFFCGGGDDKVDINPINNLNFVALLVDTGTGRIWLADDDHRTPKYYLGQIGEDLSIEGYDNAPVRANFTFKLDFIR